MNSPLDAEGVTVAVAPFTIYQDELVALLVPQGGNKLPILPYEIAVADPEAERDIGEAELAMRALKHYVLDDTELPVPPVIWQLGYEVRSGRAVRALVSCAAVVPPSAVRWGKQVQPAFPQEISKNQLGVEHREGALLRLGLRSLRKRMNWKAAHPDRTSRILSTAAVLLESRHVTILQLRETVGTVLGEDADTGNFGRLVRQQFVEQGALIPSPDKEEKEGDRPAHRPTQAYLIGDAVLTTKLS